MRTILFYSIFIVMIFSLGLGVAMAQDDYEARPYMEQSESPRMERPESQRMQTERYEESTGRGYYDPVQRNPMVERKMKNGLSYINGGVGITQRNAIDQVEDNFGLKLVFADFDGRYIANVTVDILDGQGRRVFSLEDGGPWLLTDLPPGDYQVRASFDGERKTRRVKVGRDGVRTVIMHWTL